MDKKGFTLIEVIAIILILGVIMSIAVVSVNHIIDASKESAYNIIVVQIEEGAKQYLWEFKSEIDGLEANDFGVVSVNSLLSKGILRAPVINPLTNEAFPETAEVLITRIASGIYEYEFLIDGHE